MRSISKIFLKKPKKVEVVLNSNEQIGKGFFKQLEVDLNHLAVAHLPRHDWEPQFQWYISNSERQQSVRRPSAPKWVLDLGLRQLPHKVSKNLDSALTHRGLPPPSRMHFY